MENKPKQGEKKITPACLHPSCKTLCSTGCLSLESSHLLGRSQGTCLSVQRGIKFPICPQRAWVAVTGGAAVGRFQAPGEAAFTKAGKNGNDISFDVVWL